MKVLNYRDISVKGSGFGDTSLISANMAIMAEP